jgi:hypothetical protein
VTEENSSQEGPTIEEISDVFELTPDIEEVPIGKEGEGIMVEEGKINGKQRLKETKETKVETRPHRTRIKPTHLTDYVC